MIVFPVQSTCSVSVIDNIVRLTKDATLLEEGGHMITALTLVTFENINKWLVMAQLWKTLKDTLRTFVRTEQMVSAPNSLVIEGKL